jgi:hypothetical protein
MESCHTPVSIFERHEETLTVPALQVMNKCSLLQKNPALMVPLYRGCNPADFGLFSGEVSTLPSATVEMRTLFGEVSALEAQIAEQPSTR